MFRHERARRGRISWSASRSRSEAKRRPGDDRRTRDVLLPDTVSEADAESLERNSSCLPLPGVQTHVSQVWPHDTEETANRLFTRKKRTIESLSHLQSYTQIGINGPISCKKLMFFLTMCVVVVVHSLEIRNTHHSTLLLALLFWKFKTLSSGNWSLATKGTDISARLVTTSKARSFCIIWEL